MSWQRHTISFLILSKRVKDQFKTTYADAGFMIEQVMFNRCGLPDECLPEPSEAETLKRRELKWNATV